MGECGLQQFRRCGFRTILRDNCACFIGNLLRPRLVERCWFFSNDNHEEKCVCVCGCMHVRFFIQFCEFRVTDLSNGGKVMDKEKSTRKRNHKELLICVTDLGQAVELEWRESFATRRRGGGGRRFFLLIFFQD